MKTSRFEFCWCGRPKGYKLCVKEKHELGKKERNTLTKEEKLKRYSMGTMQKGTAK